MRQTQMRATQTVQTRQETFTLSGLLAVTAFVVLAVVAMVAFELLVAVTLGAATIAAVHKFGPLMGTDSKRGSDPPAATVGR